MTATADSILDLYRQKGALHYDGEGVNQLEHAWQCGQLAKQEGASKSLQLAAWLHDIGHLLSKKEGSPTVYGHDDRHEVIGCQYLTNLLPDDVTQPIAWHVAAKRYLVTTDPSYRQTLSPDSIRSLALQGGDMSQDEVTSFEAMPWDEDAIRLRRWDDIGKQSDWILPATETVLSELKELIEECQ